ncbi:PREDICTED: uncharacterized protein LOC105452417 isoform X2 [Wasmannia auropunctata]|uniref:uncharacterized protein LOC105452417 isoform X2 n=1 Tax=Wasmannia auropunctata TaxID=64793 RepID=UPI0005EE3BFF|nr:PREDICTED: uncharacterized protein LOC105452417 isoform X2 [Wasmannia auropunctata]
MATKEVTMEEEVTDIIWEEMKTLAVEQQQCLYELLSDCTEYKSDERKYLRQNIGYAIYGPPKSTKDASETENSICFCTTENLDNTDATDTVGYEDKAEKVIDKIYNKICACTVGTDDSQPIYSGVIYNVIFRPKTNVKPKKEEVKKETKKEAKTEASTEGTKKEEAKEDEKRLLVISPVPIFTIRKNVQEKSETKKSVKQENTSDAVTAEQYETWYIDVSSRVYKDWTDYKKNNTLPKCTMVLPQDGSYQPNPAYPITEDYSTVWLEIMNSPACSWKSVLCTTMDIASGIVGVGAAGLSIASLFTPLAPVAIVSGLAATGMSGLWSFGRNSQQLADRNSHEESIHILDKEALAHYLAIFGTAVGFGVIGGSAIISNVAARGMTVNAVARIAFNTIQGGNLVLNGVGIIYQGYCMYDKYVTEKTVSIVDALNLATHIMFFCGSVVKVQFASDIIESTQGRVMSDYKETLTNKRLRKKYNRIVRKAEANNVSKISENAEVIRYIEHRRQLLPNQSATNSGSRILDNTVKNTKDSIVWSFECGRLKVNGITLLDPVEYVTKLIRLGIFIGFDQNDSSDAHHAHVDPTVDQMTRVLCDLLSKLYVSDDCPNVAELPTMPDFEPLLREMRSMHITEDFLAMLFKIAVKLMKRSRNMDDFLFQIFTFIWQYCKANLKKWGMSLCTQSASGSKILQKIIIAVHEAIDMVLDNLYCAFVIYIESNVHRWRT